MNFTYQHYALAYIIEQQDKTLFSNLDESWFDNGLEHYYTFISTILNNSSMLPSKNQFEIVGLFLPDFKEIELRYDEIIGLIKIKRVEAWKNEFTSDFSKCTDVSEMHSLLNNASKNLNRLITDDSSNFLDVIQVMEDIWFQSTYKTGKNRRVFVGYPTIDKTLGGLGGKDIMAILGRMKQGKTYYLSAMAMNAVLNGNKVLYINYEMSNQEITERILAMMTRIQEKSYRNRLMSTEELDYLKFFIENFAREYKSKFMFIGSNDTVKPKDLLRYCGSYGPDLTCLDSPYMMAKDGKQEVHAQVRNTMVQLKEVNSQLAIPSIMTFQLNREYKDKENGKEIKKATTYDIAESDFIARVASSLFTIRKDEHNDKIKHLDLIAGRGSGEVSMACNFDFVNYDFSEIAAKGTMGINLDGYHMEGMF